MPEALPLFVEEVASPLGPLLVVTGRDGLLRAVEWSDHEPRMLRLLRAQAGPPGIALAPAPRPGPAGAALARYFAGEPDAPAGLPVARFGTQFQRQVWAVLRAIPCGRTLTYGELARRIGREGAARAVGIANGSNPVSIVVPCHRVIGADGGLTGYAGGLARKRWLLEHEAACSVHA